MRTIGIGDSDMLINEIRDQVANYLAQKLSLEEFEDWIVQNTWNIHQSSDESCKKLAYAIEGKLAEYSSGDIAEESLRKELAPLVASYTPQLAVEWASIFVFGTSANVTVQAPVPFVLGWRADALPSMLSLSAGHR